MTELDEFERLKKAQLRKRKQSFTTTLKAVSAMLDVAAMDGIAKIRAIDQVIWDKAEAAEIEEGSSKSGWYGPPKGDHTGEEDKFSTIDDAIKAIRDISDNGGVYPDGTDVYGEFDFTLEQANTIYSVLEDVKTRYGITMLGVYKTDLFDNPDAIMQAYEAGNLIRVNSAIDNPGTFDKMKRVSQEGWTLASDFRSALYHEIGHCAMNNNPRAHERAKIEYDDTRHILFTISRYASTGYKEMIAESFVNYALSIKPEASILTDSIIKLVFEGKY